MMRRHPKTYWSVGQVGDKFYAYQVTPEGARVGYDPWGVSCHTSRFHEYPMSELMANKMVDKLNARGGLVKISGDIT